MKMITSVSLDVEVLERCKQMNINVSKECNAFLSSFLAKKELDVTHIDFELEKVKYESISKKIGDLQVEMMMSKDKLEKLKQLQEEDKKQALQKEKEEIEKTEKCHNCGHTFGSDYKWTMFGEIRICKACYMTAPKDKKKEWMKGG